jgi:starch-binding outer membrane protein, SusD/RagB family
MKNSIKYILSLVLVVSLFSSCFKDLDRKPFYDLTADKVFADFKNYKNVLAKIYAGLALSGQAGPTGKPDVAGIDEGFSSYMRVYFNLQELPTDEAICGWGDPGLPALNTGAWSSNNEWTGGMYYRIAYQTSLCNEFLRELTDEKLASRNITGADLAEAIDYRNEVRFLRALSYYHALDMFRRFPFTTETFNIAEGLPKQSTAKELYNFVESELLAIEPSMKAPRTNEKGRVDQAAAWMLLSKLYLNAKVYGEPSADAKVITYTDKVIKSSYSLDPIYAHLTNADNHLSNEIIFGIAADGQKSRSYGVTTIITNGCIGGAMVPSDYGVSGNWSGYRARQTLVEKFADPTGATDKRATFFSKDQNLENTEVAKFTDGYGCPKYKNLRNNGSAGSDPTFSDIDFPLFRLGDAYLMYAEANVRGGGGSSAEALGYVNALRSRAYGNETGNVPADSLNLNFLLNERSRELHWEGYRRTDLIRFGKFTDASYGWPWKGGSYTGGNLQDYKTVFPIPSSDLTANPNLTQNAGY